METTVEDYEPFGNEWFLEMKKLPKTLLIDMLRDAFISASLKEEKNKSIDEFMSDYFTIPESLEELAKKITINNNDVYLTVAGKLVKLPSPPKEEK